MPPAELGPPIIRAHGPVPELRFPAEPTRFNWFLSIALGVGLFSLALGGEVLVLFGRWGGHLIRRRRRAPSAAEHCEVRCISLAFDWTERRRLQDELERLARAHDFDSVDGLYDAAVETRGLLQKAIASVRYASFSRYYLTPEGAESRLSRMAIDLRARFTEQTIKNARKVNRTAVETRADEGEGLVVVSMIVGATVHLPALPGRLDPKRALRGSLPFEPSQLVALEVIWSPSEDSDRMSSLELEQLYPELMRLDDDDDIGRVSCPWCVAPYPAELGKCPTCGAPRDSD